MSVSKRYARNKNTFSEEETTLLGQKRVFVAGCGGLGGFVIEELARLGVGHITAVDGDVFEETNLNRQLFSRMDTLGMSKAQAARERMEEVNPEITVTAIKTMITAENANTLLAGHDAVVDALDNTGARFALEKACEELGIPMIHGAIGGWYGQVAVIFPGDRLLESLYSQQEEKGAEVELGNPSFTPAVIASIEVAETAKVLLGKEEVLRNRLLTIDLLHHEYEILEF